jgi:hypothetical protein
MYRDVNVYRLSWYLSLKPGCPRWKWSQVGLTNTTLDCKHGLKWCIDARVVEYHHLIAERYCQLDVL